MPLERLHTSVGVWNRASIEEKSSWCEQIAANLPAGFEFARRFNAVGLGIFTFVPTSIDLVLVPARQVDVGMSGEQLAEVEGRLASLGVSLAQIGVLPESLPPRRTCDVAPILVARSPLSRSQAEALEAFPDDWERPVPMDEDDPRGIAFLTAGEVGRILADQKCLDLPNEVEVESFGGANPRRLFWWGNDLPLSRQTLASYMSMVVRAGSPSSQLGFQNLSAATHCWEADMSSASRDTPKPRLVTRGGTALSWPWQHPAEWVAELLSFRPPSDRFLEYASVRFVYRPQVVSG